MGCVTINLLRDVPRQYQREHPRYGDTATDVITLWGSATAALWNTRDLSWGERLIDCRV